MTKIKKTSMLLSGVLVVFLFSSLGSFAQNKDIKKINVKPTASKDSIQALKKVRVELKKHESTLRWLNQQYFKQNLKLKKLNFQLDSIKTAVANLMKMDSTTDEFQLKNAELTILAAQLGDRTIHFSQEKASLNQKINDANNRSKDLLLRERALTLYINSFKKK